MWVNKIEMDFREIGWGGVNCVNLVEERDQWMALVYTAMKFGFHKILEGSRTAAQLAAFQVGFIFMGSVGRYVGR
jgi:hypothetical protein